MNMYKQLPTGLQALALFVKNAIIADAIGTVELKDLPEEFEPLVNVAVDKWDDASDAALDVLAAMIVFQAILSNSPGRGDSPDAADPRDHFPKF